MKIRMKAPLFVIGKPTQQGKNDPSKTYYFVTVSQGEEDAGKLRVADVDTYNRIEKFKTQLFTFEFNEQYNSFSIVDVEPTDGDKSIVENVGATATASNTVTAPSAGTPTADAPSPTPTGGKSDKK